MKWFDVALQLDNPFDFTAFQLACVSAGVEQAFTPIDYANRLGNIKRRMAEGETAHAAYIAYLDEMQKPTPVVTNEAPVSCCAPPTPSTLDKIRSAGLAVTRWIAAGAPNLERAARDHRLRVCSACDDLTGATCRICGCYVSVKTWMRTEECPKGKWHGEL